MASSSSSNAGTAGSCVHKRVSANNAGAAGSCLHKRVSSRELSGTTKFKKMSAYQRFSHFRLAAEHDTHDPVRGLPQLNKLRFASWRSPHITCLHGVFPEPHRSIADASHHASHCLALSAQPETEIPLLLAGCCEAATVLLAEAVEDRRDPLGGRPRLRTHARRRV